MPLEDIQNCGSLALVMVSPINRQLTDCLLTGDSGGEPTAANMPYCTRGLHSRDEYARRT